MLRSSQVVGRSLRLQIQTPHPQIRPSFRKLTNKPPIPPIKPSSSIIPIDSKPPFAIRTLLVGSSVALFTPLYATGGVVVAWHRLLPKYPMIQAASTMLIGGGVASLVYTYVAPFLANHSEMVLPFAAANGTISMIWYTMLEYKFGLEVMSGSVAALGLVTKTWPLNTKMFEWMFRYGVPFGGPAVGVMTAISGGYLYPIFAKICWSDELQRLMGPPSGIGSSLDSSDVSPSFTWMVDLHHLLLLPVSIPVGIASGYGLHAILSPVLLGTVSGGTIPWPHVALPILTAITAASLYYFTQCGTYDASALFWERRVDFKNGLQYSYNVRTGEKCDGWGTVVRSEASLSGVELFAWLRNLTDYTYFTKLITNVEEDNEQRFNDMSSKIGESITSSPLKFPLKYLSKHEELFLTFDVLIRLKYLNIALSNHHFKADEDKGLRNQDDDDESFRVLNKARNDLLNFVRNHRELFPHVDNVIKLLNECEIIMTSEETARQFKTQGDITKFKAQNEKTKKLLDDLRQEHKLVAAHVMALRKIFKQELGYSPLTDQKALSNLKDAERLRFGWWNWLSHLHFFVFGYQK